MEDSEVTRYDHLMSLADQMEEPPEELEGPEFPAIVDHVWEWFLELNAARSQGPISYSEIKAWSELTGQQVTPFEIKLLNKLDLEFLNQHHGR